MATTTTINDSGLTTYTASGVYRDLVDRIFELIDPKITPFSAMISRKGVAKQRTHEWTRFNLSAPVTNAQIEGFQYNNFTSVTLPEEKNTLQILSKLVEVSKSSQATKTAGGQGTIAKQMQYGYEQLMKDLEMALVGNTVEEAGDATTARVMRGLSAWISTNVDLGTGGAVGTTSDPATAGTLRALTVPMLRAMMVKCYKAGGNPTIMMAAPEVIDKVASLLQGQDSQMTLVENKQVRNQVSVWVSQFGPVQLIPNTTQSETAYAQNCIFFLDKKFWSVAYLRAFKKSTLPEMADSIRGVITTEATLEAGNESSSGMIADIDPTL